MSSSPNRLAKETSPYLLQHAHNPVEWYPWGEEAFQKATEEDKPVLVSIGYAACHWCHVMERESFEDPAVAKLMNEQFVNIKVDREERPDVDMIYMDAVQAISGSGGWPLNVFLTPDRKPFYGGTYYPPVKAFNRASWRDVLTAISAAYHEKRDEILTQAETLTEHIKRSNSFGQGADNLMAKSEEIDIAYEHVMKTADKVWGGFGRAPKFPQMAVIKFLLRYHHISGNREALEQALLSLDKMSRGGIYDHIGGGFARYSTDTEWLVPHFEKMLYDNALIVSTLCEAYLITGKKEYRNAIEETLSFVERELTHPEGGFYSTLDADSEGVEGKFYVWSYAEVVETLGNKNAAFFCKYYDITEKGNWEGQNIPWNPKSLKEVIDEAQITEKEAIDIIRDGKEKLLERRGQRVRPGLDDKILLGWNALMNTAYC
ncbi:MAG TPA: thioredoxin domain-containing protein, partial [Chitinophagaceae bacterium]